MGSHLPYFGNNLKLQDFQNICGTYQIMLNDFSAAVKYTKCSTKAVKK